MTLNSWVLASHNQGKLKEFSQLLAPLQIQLISQSEAMVPEVEEPFITFIENALHKARHASRISGLPALADDSGLTVDVLGGAPGVFSARYAQVPGQLKSDAANNQKLLATIADQHNRNASFICVLVFVRHPQDPNPLIAQGQWRGQIAQGLQGAGGFGYDPLFYLPQLGLTAAQLSAEQKNTMSHRAQALSRLIQLLQESGLV